MYQRQNWNNGDSDTPLNGPRMNYIETGLEAAARAAQVGGQVGSRVVTLGDSITIGAETHTTVDEVSGSWPAYLGWTTGQRFRVVKNAGVGGDTSAMALARFDTAVAAHQPNLVTILLGTNDVGQGVSLATFQANILAIIEATYRIGAQPVLGTIPPRQASAATVGTWNIWLRDIAQRLNIPLIDFHATLVDVSTGGFKSTYNVDGVHPNKAGYAAMAATAKAVLDPLLRVGAPLPNTAGAPNLLANALFVTESGTAGLATSWSKYGSGTWTPTLTAADVGNWQQFVISSGSATGVTQTASASVSPGERVRFVGRFEGGPSFMAMLTLTGGYYYRAVAQLDSALSGVWDVEFTAPAGSGPNMSVALTGSPGTHKVSQVGLYNLSRLGLS